NRLGITKKQFAALIDVNYPQMSNVFSGYLDGTQSGLKVKAKIIAKIQELEAQQSQQPVIVGEVEGQQMTEGVAI
ncbi:MAG: hypothetical protein FWG63_03040, partial [Defluviitaleaceae bacterium]|nr:hypothetical protein [Defluviitaleaceae bacterium]